MNPAQSRYLNQQLISPQYNDTVELVSWLGAVQAQDYKMIRWAVGMRTKSPSLFKFENAYNSGSLIRHHLMRGTWQLVTCEDFPWMFKLFCPLAKKTLMGWMKGSGVCISEKELNDVREIVLDTARTIKSATLSDFSNSLKNNGISLTNNKIGYHIHLAEVDGLLTSGDLDPVKPTYCLSSNKVSLESPLSRDESLALLARKYFQSRQPATLEDFVWWSGLGVNDCKHGIALLGDWLHVESYRGREFYISEDCRTRGFRRGQYILVPPYDEILIGYKSRDLVLPEEYARFAHNNSGNFYPIIIYDGAVCGNWREERGSGKDSRARIVTSFFPSSEGLELPSEVSEAYLKFKRFIP